MRTESQPNFVPDDYLIIQKLGSGQTSHVYLARHPQRGEVALKLPREELKDQPVLRRMFENEVQITLNLQHPDVVAGHAGYPTGEKAFLELEYCAGGTLDQLLLEVGRLSLERSLRLIADVAEGLDYSHSRRVLHRDVKPANVFLTQEGRAKLGDFGTGVFMTDDIKERVGTAFYMAPEIFEGSMPSIQSDVYSLGVLAYEVLAGVRPFLGDSYETLMMAHLSGLPKDLRQYRSDLPKGLARVVLSAISRDADRRYKTVTEFLERFKQVSGLTSAEAAAREPRVGRSSRTQTEAALPPDEPRVGREGRGAPGRPTAKPTATPQAEPATEPGAPEPEEGKREGERGGGLFGWFKKKR